MTFAKDLLGNVIKPGDVLATATLYGRSASLELRKVVSINDDGKVCVEPCHYGRVPTSFSKGTLKYPERSVIINDLVTEDDEVPESTGTMS